MKTAKIECFAVYDSTNDDPEKYVLFSNQIEASKYCDEMGEDFKVCSYIKEFKIYKSKKEFDNLNKEKEHIEGSSESKIKKNIEALQFVKFR